MKRSGIERDLFDPGRPLLSMELHLRNCNRQPEKKLNKQLKSRSKCNLGYLTPIDALLNQARVDEHDAVPCGLHEEACAAARAERAPDDVPAQIIPVGVVRDGVLSLRDFYLLYVAISLH